MTAARLREIADALVSAQLKPDEQGYIMVDPDVAKVWNDLFLHEFFRPDRENWIIPFSGLTPFED